MTALSGGIGGAKLALGLSKALKPNELTIIGNTGDDIELFGLRISPDLDIVMYTLASIVDTEKGWGVKQDTFRCLKALSDFYGKEKWFNIGDMDLATHLLRTKMLREGHMLSVVTNNLCNALGLEHVRLLPMTDDDVQTHVRIQDGSIIHFEEYFVKKQCQDTVKEVIYEGAEKAKPAKGVLESFKSSDLIIICPSNPIASIGPILSIKQIHKELVNAKCPVIIVTPLVSGKPLKGPTDKFLKGLGFEVSVTGVIRYYEGIGSHFVLDTLDSKLETQVKNMGLEPIVTNTIMNTLEDKVELAKTILNSLS